MGNIKKGIKIFVYSGLHLIINIVLGLLVPRFVLVEMGSDVNGLLNSVTNLIAYMMLFEAGIQSVAIKALYKTVGQNDIRSSNSIISAVHKQYKKIGAVYLCGLFILSLIYALFVDVEALTRSSVFIVVFFSGLANVIAFYRQAKYKILLTVDGREYVTTNLHTITTVLSNVIKIVLLALEVEIYIIIIASFIVSNISVLFTEWYTKKNYPWIDLNEEPDKNALKQSKHAFIHQISGLIFSNTDVLLLTVFTDLKTVSIYSVYKLVMNFVKSLLTIPFQSCSFALGQTFATDREKYKKMMDGFQVVFCAMVFAVLSAVYIMMPSFIGLYTKGVTDTQYIDKYLPALFVVSELVDIIRYPTRHTVNCAGHFKETVSRTITETAINLIVSVFGVIYFGIYGVLVGTIIALAYRSIDFSIYADIRILKRKPSHNLKIYTIDFMLSILAIIILNKIPSGAENYLEFVGYGIIVLALTSLIVFTVNVVMYKRNLTDIIETLGLKNLVKKRKNI